MIQRVYEQVKDVLDSVCVATDDIRIENAVKAFGGQVVMTSDQHRSGTDRCYEAYQKIGEGYDVIVISKVTSLLSIPSKSRRSKPASPTQTRK